MKSDFPSIYRVETGKMSNFKMETPKNHNHSEAIKVDFNSYSHVDSIYPWGDVVRMTLYRLCGLPPTNP